jgi:hypothetical protein
VVGHGGLEPHSYALPGVHRLEMVVPPPPPRVDLIGRFASPGVQDSDPGRWKAMSWRTRAPPSAGKVLTRFRKPREGSEVI